MAAVRVNRLARAMWRLHRWLYAKSNGRIGARIGAQRLLLLTTTGRRSGQPRSVVLTYVDAASSKVVAASYAGEDRHPDWYLNLSAHPRATIRIGNEERPVEAQEIIGPERDELYDRFIDLHDQYATYQQRTDRRIPVVALDPAT